MDREVGGRKRSCSLLVLAALVLAAPAAPASAQTAPQEVLDMLQAMNTGHDGSLSTIHANTPRDALMRLETLVAMSGIQFPTGSVRRYISSALNVIIQVARLFDGSRKIVSFQKITGMEGDIITLQEIFSFEQKGIDSKGTVKGRFHATGIRPRFVEIFKSRGIPVPMNLFNPDKVFEV